MVNTKVQLYLLAVLAQLVKVHKALVNIQQLLVMHLKLISPKIFIKGKKGTMSNL